MIKNNFSRPATYLTILALSTLTVSDCQLGRAAQPADTIQLDAHFVPFVLTSMSSLVPSPCADSASLNNPLGVEQPAASSRGEALRSVVSRNPTQAVTASLHASVKEPTPKVALPQARDFTLTMPISNSIENSSKQLAPVKNSLAMIGR